MQEHINYKVMQVINNWFDYEYDNLDYDATAPRESVPDTAYCGWCNTRKNINLMTFSYNTNNRKVAKCTTCASKLTKGIKNGKV